MENIITQIHREVNQLTKAKRESEAVFLLEKICVSSLMQLGLINHGISNEVFPASKYMDMALSIDRGDWETYHNLSHIYTSSGQLDNAKLASQNAIQCAPDNANPWYNYGVILSALKESDGAIFAYKQSLAINSDNNLAKYNLGCELLKRGFWNEGWDYYEARLVLNDTIKSIRSRFKCPDWHGQKVDKLIVYCEQGMGDTIQFSRLLPRMKEFCNTLYLEVQEPLANFYEDQAIVTGRVDGQWPVPPVADAVISICSLAKIFHYDPEAEPMYDYLYIPDIEVPNIEYRKKKIGLVWSGNPLHPLDYTRSIPVSQFGVLANDKIQLFSFQKQIINSRKWKKGWINLQAGIDSVSMVDLAPHLETMAHTAKLLKQMDVLVTVDTSVAHLAGAIGVPTFLLIPHASDWRWMEGNQGSPWYPSMTIFRQKKNEDWKSVIKAVSEKLCSF